MQIIKFTSLALFAAGALATTITKKRDGEWPDCWWLTNCGPTEDNIVKSLVIMCPQGFGSCSLPADPQNACFMDTAGSFEGAGSCTFSNGTTFSFDLNPGSMSKHQGEIVGGASAAGKDMTLMKCPDHHALYKDNDGNTCTSVFWGISGQIVEKQ